MLKYLPSKAKLVFEDKKKNIGVFEIEKLRRGYGVTIGNALRRVLLSSLPGAAIVSFKIEGVNHEFSTLPGVLEDVVEIMLNLKQIRLKLFGDHPQKLVLKAKGKGKVTAKDIEKNSNVEIVNPEQEIATLTNSKAKLNMELLVEKGVGYETIDERKDVKASIGTILLDSIFSPVRKVSYEVENMRVGEKTDFNKLKISIETDGTISPTNALTAASQILVDHFNSIVESFPGVQDNENKDKPSKKKVAVKKKEVKKPKAAKK